MMGGPHGMLGHDPENVAGSKVDTQILRRAWVFARTYRIMIIGFLATIVALAPGAQFWFGLVVKLNSLRASGPPPASSAS